MALWEPARARAPFSAAFALSVLEKPPLVGRSGQRWTGGRSYLFFLKKVNKENATDTGND